MVWVLRKIMFGCQILLVPFIDEACTRKAPKERESGSKNFPCAHVRAHVCAHAGISTELNEISQNKVSALRRSFLHWTVVQRGGSARLAGSVGFSFVRAPNCSPVGRVHTWNRRLWLFTSCLLSLDHKNEQRKQARASPASEMGFIPPYFNWISI